VGADSSKNTLPSRHSKTSRLHKELHIAMVQCVVLRHAVNEAKKVKVLRKCKQMLASTNWLSRLPAGVYPMMGSQVPIK
jgi:hypothetical protein